MTLDSATRRDVRQAARKDNDQAADADATTRAQILGLIVTDGPISAVEIADALTLAAAGIRRHLGELEADGLIEHHDGPGPAGAPRGRGRPARYFVATAAAHQALRQEIPSLAVEAIEFLGQAAGRDAIDGFAGQRARRLEDRYAEVVAGAGDDLAARAKALASAMTNDGFAATVRPGPKGLTLQLCQGHCPVHQVAEAFPEFCEAETRAISRLLGVHVQRLATLAGGEHVCTTCVPVALAVSAAPAPQAPPAAEPPHAAKAALGVAPKPPTPGAARARAGGATASDTLGDAVCPADTAAASPDTRVPAAASSGPTAAAPGRENAQTREGDS
ncbi:MAG: helix-turn-helix domain-containing protein [Bifidobacteriaceae bacterium]|jgi:predicted ArsR family transcriptional regulator|nr:helix-turn-helix domain-containing protein [Bifidobacteriaceae bacterium]